MSAEARVRTATEAAAASVRQIRPLALPDASAVSAELRGQQGRKLPRISVTLGRLKETWIIPLGAAAVVVALALTLVILRNPAPQGPTTEQPGTAAPAVTGIPRYYAVAHQGKISHIGQLAAINLTVVDVYTSKTLATVTLPATNVTVGISSAIGVSAAADDRSFVVGRRDQWGDVDYFLVHIAPGTKQVATVTRLPIPETSPGVLLGFAVSPDGKELAVLSVRGNGTTLRIYSVTSGATLRTWTAEGWQYQGNRGPATGVSWTADNLQVAFSTVVPTGQGPSYSSLEEMVIGEAEPSGDLAAASRVAFEAPSTCTSLLLTPDGGTVVCGTQVNYPASNTPVACAENAPAFVAYSVATGRFLRVLYQFTGSCVWTENIVLWSDDSARHVIGESQTTFQGNPPQFSVRLGVAAAGEFAKFQTPVFDSGPAF